MQVDTATKRKADETDEDTPQRRIFQALADAKLAKGKGNGKGEPAETGRGTAEADDDEF